jgi:vacuolar-type H+-ATPase subunit I/STV1
MNDLFEKLIEIDQEIMEHRNKVVELKNKKEDIIEQIAESERLEDQQGLPINDSLVLVKTVNYKLKKKKKNV